MHHLENEASLTKIVLHNTCDSKKTFYILRFQWRCFNTSTKRRPTDTCLVDLEAFLPSLTFRKKDVCFQGAEKKGHVT